MYRKILEKSRSFDIKRIDHFLFLAALILIAGLIAGNFISRLTAGAGRTDLFLSVGRVNLFGGEFSDAGTRQEQEDSLNQLIREFEEQNPELRIRPEDSSPPDLLIFDEGEFGGLVRDGALGSLNSYMHTESGAEQRAVPLVSFMDLLFYNVDLLRAAGFDRPPKTKAEFLACANAVSAAGNGVYGAALGLSPEDPNATRRDIFSWVWAAGGGFWPAESPLGSPVFGGRIISGVIAFLDQLNSEGGLAPGTLEKTGGQRLTEFAAGKTAMIIASSRDIPFLRKEMGGAFGVTAVPGSPEPGRNALGLSGIYAGISAGSDHPDEAWAFLVFLAEKSPALASGLRAIPGALPGPFSGAEGFSGGYVTEDPLYTKAWDIFEGSDIAWTFSGRPRADEFEGCVREEITALFEKRRAAAATVTAIQQRWDSLSR